MLALRSNEFAPSDAVTVEPKEKESTKNEPTGVCDADVDGFDANTLTESGPDELLPLVVLNVNSLTVQPLPPFVVNMTP